MVVEHDTIEEYVEVISTFDSSDQLKIISELTRRLAKNGVENTPSSKTIKTKPATIKKRVDVVRAGAGHMSETARSGETLETNKSSDAVNEASDLSLDDLFGAWKDIDKGWDKPIEQVIRESRTLKVDHPNFDT